jgi:peptidoglycan hydrolase-like protein with peptidoglycan-binding domain
MLPDSPELHAIREDPMIRRALGLVVCFAAVAGLAGCGSDTGANSALRPPALAAPPPPPPPPAQAAAPAPPVHATPHLMPGQHPRIAQIQTALNANGAQLQVDGREGAKTRTALRTFQRQHKLKVTGQPDSATAKALGV